MNRFFHQWFDAEAEWAKRMEKFEDQIDSRISNVLNRYQKARFRALVGDLVEIEGPVSKSPADPPTGDQGQGEARK